MKGNWFAERRLDYIDFRLVTVGHIQRGDIMDTFGVSMPQASADLNRFIGLAPRAMAYDKTAKRYVARKGYKTLCGHTAS
ncbi:hypothetical protein B7486_61595, partial [cyanobacterium TDX16]